MVIGSVPAARRVPQLARVLEQLRAAGVPSWAVAAEAGISHGALSEIARNKRHVTPDVAKRIAKAIGCDPSELFPEL